MVHSHTNITRLGGLAVLITYARNTRVCVRARKVVVARRHGSGDGSRGGDGCRRGCRPRSSKGSRKYYYLSEIDQNSSSCGSLVFSFSYYRYDNSRNPLRSRRGCRRNSQSSAACITIHYNIILYIVYYINIIYICEYAYTRVYIRRITYTYIIYGLHPLYYVIYTHIIIYYYTV